MEKIKVYLRKLKSFYHRKMMRYLRKRGWGVFFQEYLRGIVPSDKCDECSRWAFGDDVASMLESDCPGAWNQRHVDLFMILGCDDVEKTTMKIGKAYMESKVA